MSCVLKDKPNAPQIENLRHVPLTGINEEYELYEDGRIFSRYSGKWLSKQNYRNNTKGYTLRIAESDSYSSFLIENLLTKYIFGLPEIEGVKHKPLYENNQYEVYDNGEVYTKRFCKFLKTCYTKTNWKFVCILDQFGYRHTLYVAKAVWESFNGPLNGKHLEFINGNKKDCNINNLKIKN